MQTMRPEVCADGALPGRVLKAGTLRQRGSPRHPFPRMTETILEPEKLAVEQAAEPRLLERRLKDRVARPWSAMAIGGVLLGATFLWAYWPTLCDLVAAWDRQPDYSHGYLVVPFALYLLWARRDRFPGRSGRAAWLGLSLLGLSLAMRFVSARYYLKTIDQWSILVWLGGMAWLLGGWRVFTWSLPCVAFLWFMVPLPGRAERWLSLPLQGLATRVSAWTLQSLGQPAIVEGHTILLSKAQLEVAQACSGLRVLVGITALAVAYVLVCPQTWWERLLLLAGVIPAAILANVMRIVVTGLLYQYVSDGAARKFAHDFAGWGMILFAAGLFAGALWYVRALFRVEHVLDVGDLVRDGGLLSRTEDRA